MADSDRLRSLLGEKIPADGTDADTFFSNEEITDLLDTYGTLNAAALEGWTEKAGEYANLVNNLQGGARRDMSDLYDHAKDREAFFLEQVLAEAGSVVTRSRTRIGIIRRRGTMR